MDYFFVEYVWMDNNMNFRSKTKVTAMEQHIKYNYLSYPHWNFDGSSTGHTTIDNSEVFLEPYKVYRDIFRDFGEDVVVFCNCYQMVDGEKKYFNSRNDAQKVFEEYQELKPLFGLEQEFFIIDSKTNMPYGVDTFDSSVPHYCGVGAGNVDSRVRKFMNQVLLMAVKSGIILTGLNMEVAQGQCEFQVCNLGINACDDLVFLRYIMVRLGEDYNMKIDFTPKPYSTLNGSGCHINFSTKEMRQENGYNKIKSALEKLKLQDPIAHLDHYGDNNTSRLTGTNETSKYNDFTIGNGHRGCSIRIPNDTINKGCGYFEDRRPGANIDPYVACTFLLKSIQ
jgi:glutamine synthetase